MFKILFIRQDAGIRSWVLYAVIGMVVVVGGYLVYGTWTEGNKPMASPWLCMTEGCGHLENRRPKLGDPAPPLPCQKCGKKSLVPPHACPGCGTLVIMNHWRGLGPPTLCPQCGQEIHYEE